MNAGRAEVRPDGQLNAAKGLRLTLSLFVFFFGGGRSAFRNAPTRLAERDKLSRSISRGGQSRVRNAMKVRLINFLLSDRLCFL